MMVDNKDGIARCLSRAVDDINHYRNVAAAFRLMPDVVTAAEVAINGLDALIARLGELVDE